MQRPYQEKPRGLSLDYYLLGPVVRRTNTLWFPPGVRRGAAPQSQQTATCLENAARCGCALRRRQCAVAAALFALRGAPLPLHFSSSAVRRCRCALRRHPRCAVAAALFALRGAPLPLRSSPPSAGAITLITLVNLPCISLCVFLEKRKEISFLYFIEKRNKF